MTAAGGERREGRGGVGLGVGVAHVLGDFRAEQLRESLDQLEL